MALSRKYVEVLIDLLDIRMDTFIVQDHDDMKELMKLKKCKRELQRILKIIAKNKEKSEESDSIVAERDI